jgi:multimeric flavodoxin WrbA
MKIVGLIGSPRKNGNTDVLVQKALEGAKAQGAETTLFYLNELNIRGCQACYACKKTGHCVVNDDMAEIYRVINEADGIILGSPVYFGRFTAQVSLFMDRLFAYLKPDFTNSLGAGKKIALVFTQNQPNANLYEGLINSTAQVLTRIGFESGPNPLVGTGLGAAGIALEKEEYVQAALDIGTELASR